MYTDTIYICIYIYTYIYIISMVHIFFNIGRMCLVAPKQLNTNIIRGFVKRAQFCETCATSVKRAQLLGNVSETCTYRKHWVGAVKHVIPIYMYLYIFLFSIFICIYIYIYICILIWYMFIPTRFLELILFWFTPPSSHAGNGQVGKIKPVGADRWGGSFGGAFEFGIIWPTLIAKHHVCLACSSSLRGPRLHQ